MTFTKVYNNQVALYGRTRKAVLETIRICKDRNVLKEYLENREKEVVDIMMTLFDQEYAVERYGDEKKEEGRVEGRVEGRAEGLAEGQVEGALRQAKKTAFSLKKEGFPDTMIAKVLSTSLDTVRQWLSDIPDESLC